MKINTFYQGKFIVRTNLFQKHTPTLVLPTIKKTNGQSTFIHFNHYLLLSVNNHNSLSVFFILKLKYDRCLLSYIVNFALFKYFSGIQDGQLICYTENLSCNFLNYIKLTINALWSFSVVIFCQRKEKWTRYSIEYMPKSIIMLYPSSLCFHYWKWYIYINNDIRCKDFSTHHAIWMISHFLYR